MTAQGSAYMQFKRALAAKYFDAAWMLALELQPLPLVDALALLLLARDADPERFMRGAVRVHAPAMRRRQPVARGSPACSGRSRCAAWPRIRQRGVRVVMVVCEERGLTGEADVLRDWLGANAAR